ncbi:hypothetical protein [Halorubrum sp. DTA98]|uniref:hypothetical protein n=1 Tax=Halorubrum sp. DTA98 TaxID=3402163 RepID=UPI003AAE70EB
MTERTAESAMTVEEDGISVEKSFTDDEFPVPAVTYDLASNRTESARVRIVDTIPESFPMDRVGFHPEYESDNWTAYKDHRVEFERVLEPGESVETVFGIRSDDPDIDGFLGAPVIEHVPVGEEIEDVLGTGETDAVREVLSGDRATLPGMEREEDATDDSSVADPLEEDLLEDDPLEDGSVADDETDFDSADDADAADAGDGADGDIEPRPTDAETAAAVTPRQESDEEAVGEPHEVSDEGQEDETAPTESDVEPDDGSEPESGSDPAPFAEAGLAATLAEEIRSGDVDDDDLELLRSELDGGLPRSVDVRISRLQSSVADIEAYADALAEFIDENGTAQEVLDGLQSRVDAMESDVTAIDDRVDSADEERAQLASDIEGVEGSVIGVEETVARVERSVSELDESVSAVIADVSDAEQAIGDVEDEVSSVASDLSGLDDAVDDIGDDVETLYEVTDDTAAALEDADARVDDVEDRLGRFDAEFDDVWDDLAEVDGRLTTLEESLGDDVDDIEAELAGINDHLEELEAFRKRLNEAFGP